jgi:pimeloyl-ACP methyl ester carboxylesterase
MSWRAFYDTANPDGDYNVFPYLEAMRGLRLSRRPRFRYLRAIRKPALFLYGDQDQYCIDTPSRALAVLAQAVGPKPNIELAILADADHGFAGKEKELAEVILGWMEGDVPR